MASTFFGILPANVRQCKTISDGAKVLFAELTAMTCGSNKYVWASNASLAESLGTSQRSISRWVAELSANGFIRTDGGSNGEMRKIWPVLDLNTSPTMSTGVDADGATPSPLVANKEREREEIQSPPNPLLGELVEESEGTPEKVVALFNQFCPSLCPVKMLTDRRRKFIMARFNSEAGRSMSWFELLFKRAEASDFLTNRAGQRPKPFEFEWVMAPENCVKILEGRYDNRGEKQVTNTQRVRIPKNIQHLVRD